MMLAMSWRPIEALSEQELKKTGDGLPRRLPTLRRCWQEQRPAPFEDNARQRADASPNTLKAKRARARWRRGSSSLCAACAHARFLVLDGPSGVGKTEYARSLCGTEPSLERKAAGNDHAHLRDSDPLLHKIILWDEASVHMVIAQRKFFQCPACWVGLGWSPRARNVYRV